MRVIAVHDDNFCFEPITVYANSSLQTIMFFLSFLFIFSFLSMSNAGEHNHHVLHQLVSLIFKARGQTKC